MIYQESVIKNRKVIGVLHIADWGVTFDPLNHRADFQEAQLKTWETIEAAKLEIARVLKEKGQRDG